MTSIIDLKKSIRIACLQKRDALDIDRRIEASANLARHADEIASPDSEFGSELGGKIVSGFWPIRSEMDTRPLMFALRQHGLKLCLPVVISKTEIIFRAFEREAPLMPTGFGTHGPTEAAAVLDPDILLVPLTAFDEHGNRIGYGAGFYDRAIAKLQAMGKNPILIGVAFNCQEVAHVPTEPHDKPLQAILTETGLKPFPQIGA